MLNDIKQGFLSNPADLSKLKKINHDSVRNLVKEINSLTNADIKKRKLVIAIGSGGTISMKTENGIRIPDLNFENILKHSSRELKDKFLVKSFDAFCIDSSQMDYSHTRELAISMIYIYENIKVPFIGFLVVHGTDTMAYSGSAMSLMTGRGLPFSTVYTGSQKPIQDIMNDAETNLRNSLLTLEALHNNNMAEIVIVMGNKAVQANGAVKVDDENINAFNSPLHKYITKFDKLHYPIRLSKYLKEKRNVKFEPEIWQGDFSHTLVVKSTLGLNPQMVARQIMDENVKAVILYSYGASTAYDDIINVVAEASAKKNIPAFVVNPVNGDAAKSFYPSGTKMQSKKIIPLFMTLPSALAKIEVALRKYNDDLDAVSEFMTTNYVGEVPSKNSSYLVEV